MIRKVEARELAEPMLGGAVVSESGLGWCEENAEMAASAVKTDFRLILLPYKLHASKPSQIGHGPAISTVFGARTNTKIRTPIVETFPVPVINIKAGWSVEKETVKVDKAGTAASRYINTAITLHQREPFEGAYPLKVSIVDNGEIPARKRDEPRALRTGPDNWQTIGAATARLVARYIEEARRDRAHELLALPVGAAETAVGLPTDAKDHSDGDRGDCDVVRGGYDPGDRHAYQSEAAQERRDVVDRIHEPITRTSAASSSTAFQEASANMANAAALHARTMDSSAQSDLRREALNIRHYSLFFRIVRAVLSRRAKFW